MTTATKEREPRTYWSEPDGQIFFCDGKGYGLTDTLQTICLGEEAGIKKFFETGELKADLKPKQREILSEILEYRKEMLSEQSEPEIKRPSAIRSGLAGTVQYRTAHIKQAKVRKRSTLH